MRYLILGALLLISSHARALSTEIGPGVLTKGTQGATGGTVQELKDAGRQVVIASATAVTGVTTEALFTITVSTAFTNGTSGTSFGIPTGKTFRIQTWKCVWHDTALLVASGTCHLRVQSSGPCTVSSPIVDEVAEESQNAGAAAGRAKQARSTFPDGLELSGTQTFCLSHVDSVAATEDVVLTGYQY